MSPDQALREVMAIEVIATKLVEKAPMRSDAYATDAAWDFGLEAQNILDALSAEGYVVLTREDADALLGASIWERAKLPPDCRLMSRTPGRWRTSGAPPFRTVSRCGSIARGGRPLPDCPRAAITCWTFPPMAIVSY